MKFQKQKHNYWIFLLTSCKIKAHRQKEVKKGPQFGQIVLERGAGEEELVRRRDQFQLSYQLAVEVLQAVPFVHDDVLEVESLQVAPVLHDYFEGGENDGECVAHRTAPRRHLHVLVPNVGSNVPAAVVNYDGHGRAPASELGRPVREH